MRRKTLLWAVTFMTVGLLNVRIWAKFAMTDEPAPVERLIKNAGEYVAKHPDDAVGYYTLGRLHSLAYAKDDGQVEVEKTNENAGLPTFAPYRSVQEAQRDADKPLTPAAEDHLLKAIEYYRRATELDEKSPLYWLGYGWVIHQAHLHKLPNEGAKSHPDYWRLKALAAYQKAFDLSKDADVKSEKMDRGDSYISIEAARNATELLKNLPHSDEVDKQMATYKAAIDAFEKRPLPMTPILFPLDRDRPLDSLIDNSKTVTFDLAGFGDGRHWPWVKPGTTLLVWDPNHTGRITSGRQLFGSVTWWIFWRNGYEPLAMLDDNHDGQLTGDELTGLAVWIDRNGNGISDEGEVLPIESAGVTRISTQCRRVDGVLRSEKGVQFRDGRSVTSFDWEPTSQD